MEVNTILEPKRRQFHDADLPRELAGLEGTCVTIYAAGHRAGGGTRPAPVRLHALLLEAERQLEGRGVLPTDREILLEPLRARAAAAELHGGFAGSVAWFRTSRRFEEVTLAWEVTDTLAVEGAPFLTPLLRGNAEHREFLLLAVSKKRVRLLDCGPAGQRALDLPPGVPAALDAFQGFDTPDHTRGQTGGGASFVLDTFAEKQPQYLHDFCRAIERGLAPLVEQRGLPLVVAGATSEIAAYRAVNHSPLLVAEAVEGSPDGGMTDAELAERGRAAANQWRPADELHAVDLFLRAGPAKKATELEAMIKAAVEGRVMHLFLSGEDQQKGDVDRIAGRVLPSGAPRGTADHLVNAAAIETLRHGGAVWVLASPLENTGAAAYLRW